MVQIFSPIESTTNMDWSNINSRQKINPISIILNAAKLDSYKLASTGKSK